MKRRKRECLCCVNLFATAGQVSVEACTPHTEKDNSSFPDPFIFYFLMHAPENLAGHSLAFVINIYCAQMV